MRTAAGRRQPRRARTSASAITTRGRPGPLVAARGRAARATAAAAADAGSRVRREQVTVTWPAVGSRAGSGARRRSGHRSPPSTPIEATRRPSRQRVRHDESEPAVQLTKTPIAEPRYARRADGVGRDALLHRAHRSRRVGGARGRERRVAAGVRHAGRHVSRRRRRKGCRPSRARASINLIWDAERRGGSRRLHPAARRRRRATSWLPSRPRRSARRRFRIDVPSGMRYVYAVQAVDKSGNLSPISAHGGNGAVEYD